MKKKAKVIIGLIGGVLAIALVLVGGYAVEAASSDKKVYTLRCQSPYGPTSSSTKLVFRVLDDLEKEFPKRLNIQRFYSCELVKKGDILTALDKGLLDFAIVQPCYYPGACPEGQWPWLPFLFDSMQDSQKLWETTEIASIIKDSYEKLGVMVFGGPFTFAYEVLYTTKIPPNHPSDLKGLKLRASGGIHSAWTEQVLGVSSINVLAAEQYSALQQGIIDGAIYPIYCLHQYKYYEVVKYVVTTPVMFLGNGYAGFSKKTFEKLPADIQDAIKRISLKEARYCSSSGDVRAREWFDIVKDDGMTIINWSAAETDALRAASVDIWKEGYAAKNAKCARILDICMKYKGLK